MSTNPPALSRLHRDSQPSIVRTPPGSEQVQVSAVIFPHPFHNLRRTGSTLRLVPVTSLHDQNRFAQGRRLLLNAARIREDEQMLLFMSQTNEGYSKGSMRWMLGMSFQMDKTAFSLGFK